MKVKLLVPRSGVSGSFNIGDEVEFEESEAKRLIEAGQASPINDRKPKRKATSEKYQTPED